MPGGSDTDQPEPTAGALLVATPAIGDGIFARCVALLLQHDEEGTLGVVLTGPRGEAAAPVLGPASGRAAPPAVVFTGGPVQPEVLVVVGVDPDGRTGWVSPRLAGRSRPAACGSSAATPAGPLASSPARSPPADGGCSRRSRATCCRPGRTDCGAPWSGACPRPSRLPPPCRSTRPTTERAVAAAGGAAPYRVG